MTIVTKTLRTEEGQLIQVSDIITRNMLGDAAFSDTAPGSGRVMGEGAHGYGGLSLSSSVNSPRYASDVNDTTMRTGIYSFASSGDGDLPFSSFGILEVFRRSDNTVLQRASRQQGGGTNDVHFVRVHTSSGWGPWGEVALIGINTAVDSNGFLVESSPVVRLFSDRIEDNGQVHGADFTKKGVGSYSITGTLGFAQEGWYVKTPQDANGNIKVFVEYEYTDGSINVRTFEPLYDQGKATKGDPVDIPEGRWIDLRLHQEPDERDQEPVEDATGEEEHEFMGD